MTKRLKYSPRCMCCALIKKNPDFRIRILASRYFDEYAAESVPSVLIAFNNPVKLPTLYTCLRKHHSYIKTVTVPSRLVGENAVANQMAAVIEGEVQSSTIHERTLKRIVAEGEKKILSGEMNISANNVISAAKVLGDIEKSTKDRRLEAAKAFFLNKNATPDQSGSS